MKLTKKDFDIKFTGLKLGKHDFHYELGDEFFALFDYQEFEKARLGVEVLLEKKENSLELNIKMKGVVQVPCDITNDPFDLPLSNELDLVVKFGPEYDDTDETVLILPDGEHYVNVAQYLYELAVLAMPLKRVSPAVERGEKGQKELEILKRAEGVAPEKEEENKEIDPRWDKLKDLLN
jgi:uncharacterized metal-binding protein YceD (DUF177 family)